MANPTVNPNDASFGGAITALLKALAQTISPGLAQRPAAINQAVEGQQAQQQPGQPAPPAGQQVAPRVQLGNQSPSLGNSF